MSAKLRIIPTDEITAIMRPEPSRTAYWRKYIETNESLPHPVGVSAASRKEYILLDESSYLQAIVDAGLDNVPAQMMVPGLHESAEARLLIGHFMEADLIEFMKIFPRALEILPLDRKRHFSCEYVFSSFTFPDNQRMYAEFKHSPKENITGHLFNFLQFAERNFPVRGLVPLSELKASNLKIISPETRMEIFNLHFADLITAARYNFQFPSGMIYIGSEPRLLGMDYPLRVLRERAPIREKNRFLMDLLNFRIQHGHPEYFRNGVCLLSRH